MKATYFKRHASSGSHIHMFSFTTGVYVPDEKIVLYKEQHGSFGGSTFSITDRQELLDELKAVLGGGAPESEKVTYSDIKEFEYDDKKLKTIIKNAKLKKDLQEKVESGINILLEEACSF